MSQQTTVSVLNELIDALDRRVPHVGRAGEAAIARDAGVLREKALERIAQLGGEASSRTIDLDRRWKTWQARALAHEQVVRRKLLVGIILGAPLAATALAYALLSS